MAPPPPPKKGQAIKKETAATKRVTRPASTSDEDRARHRAMPADAPPYGAAFFAAVPSETTSTVAASSVAAAVAKQKAVAKRAVARPPTAAKRKHLAHPKTEFGPAKRKRHTRATDASSDEEDQDGSGEPLDANDSGFDSDEDVAARDSHPEKPARKNMKAAQRSQTSKAISSVAASSDALVPSISSQLALTKPLEAKHLQKILEDLFIQVDISYNLNELIAKGDTLVAAACKYHGGGKGTGKLAASILLLTCMAFTAIATSTRDAHLVEDTTDNVASTRRIMCFSDAHIAVAEVKNGILATDRRKVLKALDTKSREMLGLANKKVHECFEVDGVTMKDGQDQKLREEETFRDTLLYLLALAKEHDATLVQRAAASEET